MIERQKNEILIYQAEDGSAVTEVRLGEETVWLSQVQIAELFGRERSVITKHINHVFKEGELEKESNVQNLHIADYAYALATLDRYDHGSLEVSEYQKWLTFDESAWFFLDSVDEARMAGSRHFETAIKKLSANLGDHKQRAKICITSRPSEWRAKSDIRLIQSRLPYFEVRMEKS